MASIVVETTKNILYTHGPSILKEKYLEKSAPGKPKMMDRLQAAAGPHKSGADPHIAGRALDIILFASEGRDKFVADQLVEMFLKLRPKMKWIAVIYNGWEWNRSGIKLVRSGDAINRHVTHIHIEWAAADANYNGFEAELTQAVKGIMDFGF
jgi:hypothetical protein